MNRIPVIITVFVFGATMAVSGQFVKSVGVKTGISLANQSYRIDFVDHTLETDPLVGSAASLFMEFIRVGRLGVQADLAYITKGSKSTVQSVTVNHLDNDRIVVNEGDEHQSKFSYLSLSPLARYRIGKGLIRPYLELGPRFDLLLKYSSDSEYPLEEQNSYILGLTGGAGVELNISKLGILAGLQFQPDLSPVTNQDPLLINNNILLFTVGISYLNKK